MLFRDRTDAGRRLAERLLSYRELHPIALGLARGGVVVAAAVAKELGGDFDVLVARKVGAPNFPEVGIGAVGPEGGRFFDIRSVRALGLLDRDLDRLAESEEAEVRRRLAAYRLGRPAPILTDRYVIVVDDGLATGVTAVAACEYVRRQSPKKLILAAPVCSQQAAELLASHVDEVVCLHSPEDFRSVGEWYENFTQTTDQEVMLLLSEAERAGYLA
ncbi:phosphoribosyltransferase [Fimbriimonas ginsengisoli]|uniref:Phosphoribosyltransferase n=1 Tax=Fimbriimonas ginsengisoli Gsoil 348 TaxID=661478 RepID=A0A068NMZ6_FIMGI|nr:phosphoribosyltransferase family protein [Fimbriimonas ginsengisoli]AIE84095.1 phosphoribosyltransferase [Fimbriimonas ginsengisoli Gsoil 348]